MKTYMVQLNNSEVLYYYKTLREAKEHYRSTGYDERVSILMLEGPYFAEGFHKYRLVYSGVKKGNDTFMRIEP